MRSTDEDFQMGDIAMLIASFPMYRKDGAISDFDLTGRTLDVEVTRRVQMRLETFPVARWSDSLLAGWAGNRITGLRYGPPAPPSIIYIAWVDRGAEEEFLYGLGLGRCGGAWERSPRKPVRYYLYRLSPKCYRIAVKVCS